MKRTLVIAVFLPLFYTQLGYFGQFIWQQWRIREAAREARLCALPDADFVRIDQAAIDAAGTWEEKGKECRYRGHMYDVMRSRTVGGTTWLFCLDDENEERLDRQSEQVIRANQEHPDKRAGHAFWLSFGDIVCERPHWTFPEARRILRQYAASGDQPLPACYPEVAGPPPKV